MRNIVVSVKKSACVCIRMHIHTHIRTLVLPRTHTPTHIAYRARDVVVAQEEHGQVARCQQLYVVCVCGVCVVREGIFYYVCEI